MDADLHLMDQELGSWAAKDQPCGVSSVGEEQAPSNMASATSHEASDPVETQPKPKKKRVRRQREELLYLRKKAKQLEDELERLRHCETSAAASATDSQVTAAGTAASLWEGIAGRQRQVRSQVEDENRRLKHMLENQLALARRFECFLSGSGESSGSSLPAMAGAHCPQGINAHSPGSDDAGSCFDTLLSDLKVLYATVDQVLPLVGPRTPNPTIVDAQVLETPGANGVAIQWTNHIVIPFDWGVATRGIWRFIAHSDGASAFEDVEHHFVSDNLAIRSQTTSFEGDGGLQWRSRQVVQRFVEAERTVIISRSVWVSLDTSASWIRDARFEESLQMVVARADDGASTCVKTFTQTLPSCSCDADTGALTELVLRSIESTMRAMWPAVQSALIQEDLIQEDWPAPLAST